MSGAKPLAVVAALIEQPQTGKVLLCRRPADTARGGLWEFPGGKIEPGETPREALVREIREELDIGISVSSFLCGVEYDYPAFHLSMQCFLCSITSGEPKLLEHEAARWLSREELSAVKWLPADWGILPEIDKNWPSA